MIQPAKLDEATALSVFLGEQVEAARNAVFGLTDEEARRTPVRSVFSPAGILKHLSVTWPTWQVREACEHGDRGWGVTEEDFARFYGSFALTDDETLEQVIEGYDAATTALVEAVASMDPDSEVLASPAPWFGRPEPVPVTARMLALHQIEEFARHAGHADIIREHLDGAQSAELTMAVHRLPANDFVQPWQRAAG